MMIKSVDSSRNELESQLCYLRVCNLQKLFASVSSTGFKMKMIMECSHGVFTRLRLVDVYISHLVLAHGRC